MSLTFTIDGGTVGLAASIVFLVATLCFARFVFSRPRDVVRVGRASDETLKAYDRERSIAGWEGPRWRTPKELERMNSTEEA